MNFDIIELFCIAMFFIAFFGLITSKSMIKSVVFMSLMEMAVIMFFLSIGFRSGLFAPIGVNMNPDYVADPLPQALMITAIIIGLSVTAVTLTMLMTLFRKHNTTDWEIVKKKSAE
ncbi:MAG: cation:proton antiporter subunit C [Oscillospiraceae bacterium]|nr:cation:proton antiporter subunit C [Oscillospiraceae bacterium]